MSNNLLLKLNNVTQTQTAKHHKNVIGQRNRVISFPAVWRTNRQRGTRGEPTETDSRSAVPWGRFLSYNNLTHMTRESPPPPPSESVVLWSEQTDSQPRSWGHGVVFSRQITQAECHVSVTVDNGTAPLPTVWKDDFINQSERSTNSLNWTT